MSRETEWVSSIQPQFQEACNGLSSDDASLLAVCGRKLPYLHEVLRYEPSGHHKTATSAYETDLLIYDEHADGSWVPRLIIECKLEAVTTHDALTYSAKAATHKHVHPYLRYGILLGAWGNYSVPPRLVRHGAYFDFMAAWHGQKPDAWEWDKMRSALSKEITASRKLQQLQADRHLRSKDVLRFLHRPLELN